MNPYLYQSGGSIRGDYKFQKGTKVSMQDDADIELAEEESRLQMKSDPNNYLCFRDGETYVNLDLEVGGSIHATALDVDRLDIGEDIAVKGDVVVEGNTDVQTITANKDATVKGNVTVEGNTDVQTITANKDATVKGNLTVEGNTDVQTLTAHEDATFAKKLTADEITTDELTVNNNFTYNNHLDVASLTVTGKTKTDTLEVTNNTTLNGLSAGSTSLGLTTTTALTTATLTSPIILSESLTMAIGFNSVIINPLGISCLQAPHPGPGGSMVATRITMDTTHGTIFCNGGLTVKNDNILTNPINPIGITTDFITTAGHRSDFGMNGDLQSISAEGEIAANEFHVPYLAASATHLGGITLTESYHTVAMKTPKLYASEIVPYASDTTVNVNSILKVKPGESVMLKTNDLGSTLNGIVNVENLFASYTHTNDLAVGTAGSGVVDFTDVEKIDFTGLSAAQIVNFPLAIPDGLQNIHDTETGVIVDDDIQVDKIKPNTSTRLDLSDFAEVWVHKLQTDFLEPTIQQSDGILRVNGFDQVRIANDLNVLGHSVLGPTNISGPLDGTSAEFSGDVTAANVLSAFIGPSSALRTEYIDGALPYIGQRLGANTVHFLMKEDLGIGYQTVKQVSLAHRNVQWGLELDNQSNPMNPQFGTTPLMIHLWPKNTGFDNYDSFIDCYLEDSSDVKASIRHDGAIWGDAFGFNNTMTTQMRCYRANNGIDWIRFVVNNSTQLDILPDQAVFYEKIVAPNVNSSGSFTHCHVCEPEDQETDWDSLTGRLIESTGQCAVRDDNGNLVTDYTQAPSLNHAMASVRLAQTSVLGVLNSVEVVADGEIRHDHGITLRHKVNEEDGHKVLRVCSAGDTFVWVVRPVANEILLTPALLSGLFTKYVNGVEQTEKVVVTCHEDYSFQMIINIPNVVTRLTALEEAFAELTNA